ncbi:NAD-dependent deacetylase sir2A [Diplonema papillatum]|nr:NAD-dependent deacetylase sir2A [Diplonema papillatum]
MTSAADAARVMLDRMRAGTLQCCGVSETVVRQKAATRRSQWTMPDLWVELGRLQRPGECLVVRTNAPGFRSNTSESNDGRSPSPPNPRKRRREPQNPPPPRNMSSAKRRPPQPPPSRPPPAASSSSSSSQREEARDPPPLPFSAERRPPPTPAATPVVSGSEDPETDRWAAISQLQYKRRREPPGPRHPPQAARRGGSQPQAQQQKQQQQQQKQQQQQQKQQQQPPRRGQKQPPLRGSENGRRAPPEEGRAGERAAARHASEAGGAAGGGGALDRRPAAEGDPPGEASQADLFCLGRCVHIRDQALARFAEHVRGTARNVVVLCGAGISVAAGIADFRTPGTGLYDNLAAYNLPQAEDLFSLQYFRRHPESFYRFSGSMWPDSQVHRPTRVHRMLKALQDRQVLLRVYTQNIDGLERTIGITQEKLVEAHGGCTATHCIDCQRVYPASFVKDRVAKGNVPLCLFCRHHRSMPLADVACAKGLTGLTGLVKPKVVFFEEDLPDRFYKQRQLDLPQADALIIVGTSLTVFPFNKLPCLVAPDCPRLVVDNDAYTVASRIGLKLERDAIWNGDCQQGAEALMHALGWSTEDW